MIVVAVLAPLAAGAQAAPQAPPPNPQRVVAGPVVSVDRVVAVVGDQPLLWTDIVSAINQRRAAGLQLPPDSAGQAALARSVLNELVDEEILVQKAKELKLEPSETEINNAVDRQLRSVRAQFKGDDEYRTELRNAGLGSPEDYRRTLVDQYRRQNLQQKAFAELRRKAKPANIGEEEITAAFEKSRNDLQKRPATVTFRQIIIAPKASETAKARARARADSLLAEIRKGGDFEQIAKRESMDPASKAMGGDLGWSRRGGGLVPEFENVLFALRPGDLSPVVETAFGYHIIRVDRVQAGEAKARHILISPVIDSADVIAARTEADSVAARWRRGVSYDSLTARYHDPTEEKGVLQPFLRDSLPESYQSAVATAKAGDITAPFQLANPRGQPKFGVLQLVTVTEAGQYVAAEVREQIRTQLSEERAIRLLLDEMRKHTYVSLRL